MEERRLGTQGLSVAAIGLGCMGMSHAAAVECHTGHEVRDRHLLRHGARGGRLTGKCEARSGRIAQAPRRRRDRSLLFTSKGSRKYLDKDLAAVDVKLSGDDLAELNMLVAVVSGDRYPAQVARFVER